MKKIIFIIIWAIIHQGSFAQNSYNIVYQITRWNADLQASLPILETRLLIKDSVSYEYPLEHRVNGSQPAGSKFRVHSNYKNISSNFMSYQSQPGNRRKYLIIDTIPKMEWNILSEQEIILNYTCKKASVIYNGKKYVAWYTEQIPLSFGPGIFGGLPGLILQLKNSILDQMITATSISTEDVKIQVPSKGKKITSQKFQEILKNK